VIRLDNTDRDRKGWVSCMSQSSLSCQPLRHIQQLTISQQCTLTYSGREQDRARNVRFKVYAAKRTYLPAYLIKPRPTAILQSSRTENQKRKRSKREEEDMARNDRWAAGEDRASMRYRMNTHPKGI
jgi:hypothetical protein